MTHIFRALVLAALSLPVLWSQSKPYYGTHDFSRATVSPPSNTVVIQVFAPTTNNVTGDGAAYFPIPAELNGRVLTDVEAHVVTTGTTGTLNIDLARCDAVASGNTCSGAVADMLSTNLTIDTGESKTSTAAAAAAINAANDDVDTDEVIRVDVDAVHTTPAQGLVLILIFGAA